MANRVTFLVDGFNLYFSFRIRAARYAEHQFPDPVQLSDGRVIPRPKDW